MILRFINKVQPLGVCCCMLTVAEAAELCFLGVFGGLFVCFLNSYGCLVYAIYSLRWVREGAESWLVCF